MIAYIKGILAYIGADFIVAEAYGLGYRIFVPASTLQKLPAVGQEVKLFTHHYVREDAMLLYGFLTAEEQEIFGHLISISGIGPKGALSIQGVLYPGQLIQAVAQGDIDTLTQIPGVGRKTAQRLTLELKDKLQTVAAGAAAEFMTADYAVSDGRRSHCENEAYEALLALGYTAQEAGRALAEVRRTFSADMASDALVRQALRVLTAREGK